MVDMDKFFGHISPRDPARIPRILEKLSQFWHDNPDLRLGQIIEIISGNRDIFMVEDHILEDALDHVYEP